MSNGGFFNIPGLLNYIPGVNIPNIPQGFTVNMGNNIKPSTLPINNRLPDVTQSQLEKGIGGVYDLQKGTLKPRGIMGFLSNVGNEILGMEGNELMSLLNSFGSLFEEPEQEIKPLPMPGASSGLKLPEVDLMQYYKGLL